MLRRLATWIIGIGCLGLAGIGSSCNLDPVHRNEVNELGAEQGADYPVTSQYHRPGEPCALCHSDKGPADTIFALGGTVFWGPDSYNNRVDKAYVRILDANKTERCFVTNCNGNFYVTKGDFEKITFPLLVSVERTKDPGKDETTFQLRRMTGHIGREASCATCHIQGLRDFGSPGQVHLFDSEAAFKAAQIKTVDCPPPPDYQIIPCPEDVQQ
jgi:hypothetical protein